MNKVQFQNSDFLPNFFLIIPTILILISFIFFPSEFENETTIYLYIPLFLSLTLLGIGFYLSEKNFYPNILKMSGWIFFSFYWITQIKVFLGYEDLVNASLCILGIYVLFYFAYREWLSYEHDFDIDCLDWAAGTAAISGWIYFGIEITPLSTWLIEVVAQQSGSLLNLFTGNVEVFGRNIFYDGKHSVSIIFACTAIQSMVIFVGIIFPLKKVEISRKIYGFLLTIIPVYLLNLIRNASIAYMMGEKVTSFSFAHNVLGKGGSLIALIVLLFIVARFIPEIFDEIYCLMDLPKRKGPLEEKIQNYFKRVIK
ncbi:MAG: archaeosortase A [Candidatus Thermoplasmatota archaeon]